MSISKNNDGTFLIDVRIRFKSKVYRKRERFTGNLKAAKRRELDLFDQLKAHAENRSLTKISTFGEALNFYRERRELGRSECLINRMSSDLGDVPIDELANRFDYWLQEAKQQYKTATLNRYLAWSNAALNLSVRHGHIKENPLRHFKRLKEVPRDRLLTDDEKERLFAAIETEAPHLYYIVAFALTVPCRKSELVAMRREWYDMINNCVHIPASYTKTKRPVIKPVPEGELTDYFRNIPKESEFIFYRKVAKRYVSLGDFKKSWQKVLKKAEIHDFRFHDGRRGSYTDLILAGNHPAIVQKISGHASDMSKVYLNISNMQAVKAIKFSPVNQKSGHKSGHTALQNE